MIKDLAKLFGVVKNSEVNSIEIPIFFEGGTTNGMYVEKVRKGEIGTKLVDDGMVKV